MKQHKKIEDYKDLMRERLSPCFVYEAFDDKTNLFFNRKSVGFVLKAMPLVGAEITAQNEIAEFLKDEENLPAGSSLQVLMIGSDYIDEFLKFWHECRQEDIFKTLAEKRIEFFKEKAKNYEIRDCTVLISVTVPDVNADIEAMQRRRDILKNTFQSIGLLVEDVDAKGLLRYLRLIFGHRDIESWAEPNKYEVLAEQILRPDFSLEVGENLLKINDDEGFIALEVGNRPNEWRLANMGLFLGNELRKDEQVQANFLIHIGVQILPNQVFEKTAALTKREAIAKNIKGGLGKFFPDLEEEYRDIDKATRELQSSGRMIDLHMHAILHGKINKLETATSNYCSMMRRNGFYFHPARFDHLQVLLASMPMQLVEEDMSMLGGRTIGGYGAGLKSLGRGIKTVSTEIRAILPLIAEFKGMLTSPGMLLTGRQGQIQFWSPFGQELIPSLKKSSHEIAENYNTAVVGTAGSGKSVFMQELVLSTLGVGGKVFVLDYGRSFERECLLLKGNYVGLGFENPISINPFSEVPEGDDKTSREMRADFLGSFPLVLETMAAPEQGTTDLQSAILKKALMDVWNKKKSSTEITDIAECLANGDTQDAKDLAMMLFPYTRDGQYGVFFTGKSQLNFNERMVVIETDFLRNFPQLMEVLNQMIIANINLLMAREGRKAPKLLIFDEITKTLAGKKTPKYVQDSGRIVRKYLTSIVVATQHLTDFFSRDRNQFEEIFLNCSFKVIMKQDKNALQALTAHDKLKFFVDSNWKMSLMSSIGSVKGKYSEAAMFGPYYQFIVSRLRLDPFNLLCMTTDPKEFVALDNLMKGGCTVTEAIEQVLAERDAVCS